MKVKVPTVVWLAGSSGKVEFDKQCRGLGELVQV